MHIGLVLPQRGVSWAEVRDSAQRAEEMGCDSVWVIDHLLSFPPEAGLLEAWTLLSALAVSTTRVQLGAQVLCQSFRNPALLAKMAATLDDVSGGRFRLLIGAGWLEAEYKAFGYEFPAPRTLISELRETVRILKGLLKSGEPFTFEGKHYQTNEARNLPLRRSIPVEVGGGRDRLMKLVAKEADGWNCPAILLGNLNNRIEFLQGQCEQIGRKIQELHLSCQITCTVGDAEADDDKGLQFYNTSNGFTGTVEEATVRAKGMMALGMSSFNVVIPSGEVGWKCLERLIEQVRPAAVG